MLDMSEVDVILISNYHCMMALPFMTEYTSFKGVVYATEPTLHLGRFVPCGVCLQVEGDLYRAFFSRKGDTTIYIAAATSQLWKTEETVIFLWSLKKKVLTFLFEIIGI